MKKASSLTLFVTILSASTVLGNAPASETCPPPCPPPCPVVEPVPCPTPIPPGCKKAFEGFFVGGLVGLGAGNVSQKYSIFNQTGGVSTNIINFRNRLGVKGIVGGFDLGYNWRMAKWGLGLEAVVDWSNINGQYVANALGAGADRFSATLFNTWQIRGNLSYIIQELVAMKLIVGWELGRWKEKKYITSCDTRDTAGLGSVPFEVKRTKDLNALVLGTGVDFLMTGNITMGIDWTFSLYNKLTTKDTYINSAAARAAGAPDSILCAGTIKPQVVSKIALTAKYIF